MMKLLTVIALLAVFLLPAAAIAGKETAYERVMRTGTIRCGYGVSPPILVVDPNTGNISGLSYDVWQEIGRELDLHIEFSEEAGWGNFIEGLNTGRYDAFCSGLWADPARTKNLSLTIPVVYSFLKAYARAGDTRFDGDIDKIDAPSVTIPAIEGDISVSMAKSRFPNAEIHYLPQTNTVSDMFMAVKSGKADVFFLDQAMADIFEDSNPGELREVPGIPPSFVFPAYYGVRSGEIQLRDMIDVALRKIIDDGRLEKISRRYSKDYVMPAKNYE